ncbi:hypothetical protein MRB53_037406 [Persea americana]|nr:hypothetical protein MRB53_037406 [Persea americana]
MALISDCTLEHYMIKWTASLPGINRIDRDGVECTVRILQGDVGATTFLISPRSSHDSSLLHENHRMQEQRQSTRVKHLILAKHAVRHLHSSSKHCSLPVSCLDTPCSTKPTPSNSCSRPAIPSDP